jgi:hypothetical protein
VPLLETTGAHLFDSRSIVSSSATLPTMRSNFPVLRSVPRFETMAAHHFQSRSIVSSSVAPPATQHSWESWFGAATSLTSMNAATVAATGGN